MFGRSALHALTPHPETRGFHFFTHDRDYLCFTYTKLHLYSIKWSPVLPCHLNYSINFLLRHTLKTRVKENCLSIRKSQCYPIVQSTNWTTRQKQKIYQTTKLSHSTPRPHDPTNSRPHNHPNILPILRLQQIYTRCQMREVFCSSA